MVNCGVTQDGHKEVLLRVMTGPWPCQYEGLSKCFHSIMLEGLAGGWADERTRWYWALETLGTEMVGRQLAEAIEAKVRRSNWFDRLLGRPCWTVAMPKNPVLLPWREVESLYGRLGMARYLDLGQYWGTPLAHR